MSFMLTILHIEKQSDKSENELKPYLSEWLYGRCHDNPSRQKFSG